MKTHFLIGAANSGAGKTTLTVGLLRALTNRGLRVQSFKCGPDYIDTRYHAAAAFTSPVNLDTWMASKEHVRNIYRKYSAGADCCVTEGVMGLFDGYYKMNGSSAEIASLLDIPVILVVNAASSAYSVAATIYGFKNFSRDVNVAGVIFNKVSSESHYSFLKDACNDVGIDCFGYIPNRKDIVIPSRHLGLNIDDKTSIERYISLIADAVSEHVDIDAMLAKLSYDCPEAATEHEENKRKDITIAMACDEAFNFTYRENIEALGRFANVVRFSPLRDKHLPKADIVYLPGGYPELYARQLDNNTDMKREIAAFAEAGGRIFAECGGMMYLCRTLNADGCDYAMCGVLPLEASMKDARLALGYRKMTLNGCEYFGHEFHYSHLCNADAMPSSCIICNVHGKEVPVRLYRYKNVIAGYTHWYWGERDFMDFWK